MSTPIAQTIELLSKEKNIDAKVIISAIEDAVVTASRKHFKSGEDLHARYNPETEQIELYAIKRVVDHVENPATEISLQEVEEMGVEGAEVDDLLEFPRPVEELGRIAAQTAKQIIFQKVREAERNNVYEEYIGRIGELVNGHVKRFEGGGRIIVDLGKVEAVLPRSEQSKAESFSQGERIRAVINNVTKDAKGPQVEISRSSPNLLIELFKMEVPEIYDGTVEVKAAVREPGERAKIAVVSHERDVDPVGACVGMKGSRVQAIIRELRGEKIDIIEWSEDPTVFAANALSPAKVSKVQVVDFANKRLEVVVDETQLSLAIGKHGQNVRLAAKLVGWNIDIKNEEEMKREIQSQMEALLSGPTVPLTMIEGLNPSESRALLNAGIETVEQLAEISVDDLVDLLDISLDDATGLLDSAQRIIAAKAQRAAQQAQAPEAVAQELQLQEEASLREADYSEQEISEEIADAEAPVETGSTDIIDSVTEASTAPAETTIQNQEAAAQELELLAETEGEAAGIEVVQASGDGEPESVISAETSEERE